MLLDALQALALAPASAAVPAAGPMITVAVMPISEAPATSATLAKGTAVALLIKAALSSSSAHLGDRFPIELADPLIIDGKVVLAPGTAGEGKVVHAAKARWGGKAGELIVNARFLDCRGFEFPSASSNSPRPARICGRSDGRRGRAVAGNVRHFRGVGRLPIGNARLRLDRRRRHLAAAQQRTLRRPDHHTTAGS